jgi:hypothetical protein
VAAALGVPEYRLKAKAQRATLDVELSRLFAELVPIANGRGPPVLSEAVVDRLLAHGDAPSSEIARRAMIHGVVGVPTQAAALLSLAVLGRDYPNLREPARAALHAMEFMEEHETLGKGPAGRDEHARLNWRRVSGALCR